MSYENKDVTKEEINLWKKNKLINPRTNRKIKIGSKIYKYLEQMEKIKSSKKNEKELKSKDEDISELKNQLDNQNIEIKSKDENISELKNQLENQNIEIKSKDENILLLNNNINNLETIKKNLKIELEEKNKQLEENNKKFNELKKQIITNNIKETDDKSVQNTDEDFTPNNLILVLPIALFCIGWAVKSSLFGF